MSMSKSMYKPKHVKRN